MSKGLTPVLAVTVAWCLLVCVGALRAGTVEGNPADYRHLITKLKAGDTLRLAAGEYKDQLRLIGLNGEAGKPIVVTGPENGEPATFVASPEHNTIELRSCSHVTLRNFRVDGRNYGGPMAVLLRGGGHHLTLENLTIVGYGNSQSLCGIGCYDGNYYWDCVIRGCRIIAPGTGMYLGQWEGKGGFVRGLIENNLVLDPVGYCAQLKPQTSRPEDVPEGQTIIRNNVFAKTRNASGGALVTGRGAQRPCLNINPFPASGRGSNDMYLIYGNLFYQNCMNDALFQGAGNIALYNNLFVNEIGSTDAINFQRHVNGKIRKLWVFNNTVVCKGRGIHIGSTDDTALHVFGNAVFAGTPVALSANVKAADNLTGTYQDAAQHLNAPFAKIGELDVFPRAGRLAAPKDFDYSGVRAFRDWDVEFNGAKRQRAFWGAYAGEGRNPGWRAALDFKKIVSETASAAGK